MVRGMKEDIREVQGESQDIESEQSRHASGLMMKKPAPGRNASPRSG